MRASPDENNSAATERDRQTSGEAGRARQFPL
jgi:hypothetical protein